MEVISLINFIVSILFSVLFAYKIVIGMIGLFTKRKFPNAKKNHTFAVLIAGRNEEKVIGQLIQSIANQKYDKSLISIYIVADNCTDNTAEIARQTLRNNNCNGQVFERFNTNLIGKGYALDFLLERIKENPEIDENQIDAFLVFDADNLLDENYIFEMNKVLDAGYEISTSYRNSKNFDTNWISANSAMMFLRECRFIHTPRSILNSSTFISGTGFMVSTKILNTKTGWKYTTLTEDIEFSTCQIAKGKTITYCDDAVFYDEQPVTFKASWNQRMRWQKGFYQCFAKYFLFLISTLFTSHWFATYEMMIMIFPFTIFSFFWTVFYYIYAFVYHLFSHIQFIGSTFMEILVGGVTLLIIFYLLISLYGFLILITERKRVKSTFWQKIKYSLTFPIFLASYIPIAIVCLFKKVKWKHIPHEDSRTIDEINQLKK